jgi:hypothetical protein
MAANCLGYPVSTFRTRLGFLGFILHGNASCMLRGIGAQRHLSVFTATLASICVLSQRSTSSHGFHLFCFNAFFLARASCPRAIIKVISVAL